MNSQPLLIGAADNSIQYVEDGDTELNASIMGNARLAKNDSFSSFEPIKTSLHPQPHVFEQSNQMRRFEVNMHHVDKEFDSFSGAVLK